MGWKDQAGSAGLRSRSLVRTRPSPTLRSHVGTRRVPPALPSLRRHGKRSCLTRSSNRCRIPRNLDDSSDRRPSGGIRQPKSTDDSGHRVLLEQPESVCWSRPQSLWHFGSDPSLISGNYGFQLRLPRIESEYEPESGTEHESDSVCQPAKPREHGDSHRPQ